MAYAMTSLWRSNEEMENDLFEFSEIAVGPDEVVEPPPASILQYKAQMSANHNCSIFDSHLPSEDVTYLSSGRGRGGLSRIYKPGIPIKDHGHAEDLNILQKIREVSGVGYSNEIIEKSLKVRTGKNIDQEFSDAPCPYNQHSPAPIIKYSPNLSDRTASPRSSSSASPAPNDITSCSEKNKEAENKPPPLSVLLKRAKQNIEEKKPTVVYKSDASFGKQRPRSETVLNSPQKNVIFDIVSTIENESDSSSTSFTTADNDVSWRRNDSSSSADESLSWRRRTNSPPKYFSTDWRKGCSRQDKFNIHSDQDFPKLS